MKTQDMHIGMHITHPDLGVGEVIGLGRGMAEIEFETGVFGTNSWDFHCKIYGSNLLYTVE